MKEVLVHEGDRVAPGQPILTFEPADWPAQLVQAEARVAQLEANLEKLQRGARPERLRRPRRALSRRRLRSARPSRARDLSRSRQPKLASPHKSSRSRGHDSKTNERRTSIEPERPLPSRSTTPAWR